MNGKGQKVQNCTQPAAGGNQQLILQIHWQESLVIKDTKIECLSKLISPGIRDLHIKHQARSTGRKYRLF